MRPTTMRRALLTALSAAMLSVPWSSTAWASCAVPPGQQQLIDQARTVFVGTVEEVTNERYWATVRVEEIWKGPDLPPLVEVHGSEGGGPNPPRSSVDRSYLVATRYLFVLRDEAPPLRDDACSGTAEWQEAFAAQRPADIRQPTAGEDPGDGTTEPASDPVPAESGVDPQLLVGVGAGVGAVLLAGWRWYGRGAR